MRDDPARFVVPVQRPDGTRTMIAGRVAPGFEDVADEFCRNFAERGEVGAACAVVRGGRWLVDLWGGLRDRASRAPWRQDTLVPLASATKGMSALTLALAHSRGWLDHDERVAAYWPEFGQAGKERVTVRQLLAHQAGLCALDRSVDLDLVGDPDRLAEVLARQRPAWPPGTAQGYHPITLGWYEGELLRRVDPRRRTLGRFLAEELARPLGLDLHVGLPAEVAEARLATIDFSLPRELARAACVLPRSVVLALLNPRSLVRRAYRLPRTARRDRRGRLRELLSVEAPGYGGAATARDLAALYAAFAAGGGELGLSPATLAALEAVPRPAPDRVLGVRVPFSLGLLRPSASFRFGTDDRAYGMPGLGGSIGYADPSTGVGFAYGGNQWQVALFDQPRRSALMSALRGCLARQGVRARNQMP